MGESDRCSCTTSDTRIECFWDFKRFFWYLQSSCQH
jgi:hypothetical protein